MGPAPSRSRAADWFADERGTERRLRVSWHPERRLVVLSVWHGDRCTTTFRLPLADVPRLVRALLGPVRSHRRASRHRRRR